jgi:aminodeoxyfutalosine deaminase
MLETRTSQIGEIIVLYLSGRIDAINASTLQEKLDTIIAGGAGDKLLLHCKDVNYLSAAALRVLRNLKQSTTFVRIVEPSDRVIEVMQITGLDAVYTLYGTLTKALADTRPIVNAHTHLELGWLKAGLPDLTGSDFVPWMRSTIYEPFQRLETGWEKTFLESINAGIKDLIASGVTTVGDISETGFSIQPLLNAGLGGVVYIEILGDDASKAEQRFHRMENIIKLWKPRLKGNLRIGIAPHTPYSLSRELWAKVLDFAKAEDLPLCVHVAESSAETEYLQEGTGALKDVYYPERIFEPPRKSPLAYLEELGALALKPLLIHTVQVSDEDIALIKKYGCTVVHCPRSNLRLRCGRMPLEKFLAAEIPVLIGTDSLASSPSLNIFEEMEVAHALHYGKIDPQQLVKMAHGKLP